MYIYDMNKKYLIIFITFFIILLSGSLYLLINNKKVLDFTNIKKETEYYILDFDYPEGNKVGIERVKEFIDSAKNEFEERAEFEVSELKKEGFNHKYGFYLRANNYETDNYLSYVLSISQYTGGANMNEIVKTFVFDKLDNNQVYISDIFSEEKVNSLVQSVKNDLKEKESDYMTFPGVFEKINIDSLDKFYITDSKVVFMFSKYEVSPGAVGVVSIEIDK
jgi:hypothetical protein